MQAKQYSPALTEQNHTRLIQVLHIILIAISAFIYIGSALFSSIWFDEAYTVGAVSNGMLDMIYYLSYDVHPHLYYILLKLWSYVFGNSVIMLRMFSAVFGVACVALGYTHIRNDFGDKTGFWFSFFILFSFSTLKYAIQIRMYTLAIFLITLTAIYAYRRLSDDSRKNRILYLVFSILSAYTHYFAFFIIAMINAFTLVRAFMNTERSKMLKTWLFDAVIQFGGYSVGLAVFLFQISLGGADWIRVTYPDVLYDTFAHTFFADPLSGIIPKDNVLYDIVGIISSAFFFEAYTRLRFLYKTNKEKYKAPFLAASVCMAVLAFVLVVSFFRAVYYVRYSVCFTGLAAFAAGYCVAQFKKRYLKAAVALFMVICFLFSACILWKENFSENNVPYTEQLDVREGDLIIIDNFHAFVCTVSFPENDVVFNNLYGWPVDKTYRLFGENVAISRDISEYDDFTGRIWICGDATFEYFDTRDDVSFIEERYLHTDYHSYGFHFKLYEKTQD